MCCMCISLSFSHLNKCSLILHPSMMDMLPAACCTPFTKTFWIVRSWLQKMLLWGSSSPSVRKVENQKEIEFYEEERKRTKKEMEINLRSWKQTLRHQQTILIICILPQMNIFIQQMFFTSSKLNYKPRSSSTYEHVWPFWFDTDFYCQILAGINPEQEHPESTPRSQI